MICNNRRKISANPKMVFNLKWNKNIHCKANSQEIVSMFFFRQKRLLKTKKLKKKRKEIT